MKIRGPENLTARKFLLHGFPFVSFQSFEDGGHAHSSQDSL